jgi:hypothetical protein
MVHPSRTKDGGWEIKSARVHRNNLDKLLEESACHLLRYVSGFLFERVAGHGRVVARAGCDGDGEDLIANAAYDFLPIGLAFDLCGTCLVANGLQRARSGAASGLVGADGL